MLISMALLSESMVMAYNYFYVSIRHRFLAYIKLVWPTIAVLLQ